MTTDEKIRELAEILEGVISAIQTVVPHNYRTHLEWLQERAEALAEEDIE